MQRVAYLDRCDEAQRVHAEPGDDVAPEDAFQHAGGNRRGQEAGADARTVGPLFLGILAVDEYGHAHTGESDESDEVRFGDGA